LGTGFPDLFWIREFRVQITARTPDLFIGPFRGFPQSLQADV